MYTTKNSWTATHNKNTQTSTTLKCKAFAAKFYTGRVLHQKMLTPQNLLGQRVFSPKCLDQTTFTTEDVTSKRLHHKTFDTRGILEQRHFIPKSFYARKFLQNHFTLGTFTTKYVYAAHLLHQTSTVHQRVFIPKDFDTTKFYTRKLFRNVEPQTFHTNPILQQTL